MSEREAQLLAALDTMRARMDQLEAQLAAARLHTQPSMKARLRCPACGSARLAHAERVLDRGDAGSVNAMSLAQVSAWTGKVVGELEAFACTECGLLEWYVKDPGGLREVKGQLTILDGGSPETGPYR